MIVGFLPERIRDLERSRFHSLKSIEDDGEVLLPEMMAWKVLEKICEMI